MMGDIFGDHKFIKYCKNNDTKSAINFLSERYNKHRYGKLDPLEMMCYYDVSYISKGFLEACRRGYLKLVKTLLTNFYSWTYIDNQNDGFTIACQYKQVSVARYLIHKINKNTINDLDLFVKSCFGGSIDIIKLIMFEFSFNKSIIINIYYETPMITSLLNKLNVYGKM